MLIANMLHPLQFLPGSIMSDCLAPIEEFLPHHHAAKNRSTGASCKHSIIAVLVKTSPICPFSPHTRSSIGQHTCWYKEQAHAEQANGRNKSDTDTWNPKGEAYLLLSIHMCTCAHVCTSVLYSGSVGCGLSPYCRRIRNLDAFFCHFTSS